MNNVYFNLSMTTYLKWILSLSGTYDDSRWCTDAGWKFWIQRSGFETIGVRNSYHILLLFEVRGSIDSENVA